jgi:ABC-type nitrate/sulfonate/bicarbonate transport system permease component
VIARRVLGLAVFAAALGAWEAWARAEPSFLVPAASTVVGRAWHVWPTRDFLSTVGASLTRLALGFAIGAGVGIAVGLLVGASQHARRALEPLIELTRATPAIAIVPAAIVLFGLGNTMPISVIAFGVCFPVLVNTAEGVRGVSPEARDTAAMLHVGPLALLYRLYLPAALPSIVAGLRVAISIGLVLVVLSEFFGASDGLGRYILDEQSRFDVPEMWAGILFLGLLGYVLNQLFVVVERRALAWHYGATGELER